MKLGDILAGVQVSKMFETTYGHSAITHEVHIHQLQYDSRKVQRGDCFVAIRGSGTDGHRFIELAIGNGAAVVVLEQDSALSDYYFLHSGVAKVVVPDSRKALAVMSANYYNHPSRALTMVGVTGTNGKTTTTHLIKAILEAAGQRVGLLGTIEYRIGDEVIPASHTTPESLELNELLARMVNAGCQSVSMEVSSHALHQSRVYGLDFGAAVFTNLTQDHLDYHGTMEEYFRAKRILFESLKPGAVAITNADDVWGMQIVSSSQARVFSYGVAEHSDIRASDIRLSIEGTSFTLWFKNQQTTVTTPLVGGFNVYNVLAAYSTGLALGHSPETLEQGIRSVNSVRGRFERIASPKGWTAIIDYAHTPDALEKCLRTIHDVLPRERRGRIITVFGAGGDRDKTKRPLMGNVAGQWSDIIIVTSDNPRTEKPQGIIDEIVSGIPRGAQVTQEIDRRTAIHSAVRQARSGDVVLIAGKGHEDYQVIGKEKIRFSDREIVEELIRE
jgi:UDP-N-acetylmuramoyl-L-alanyl-D-glutamate--2,6-diaminopimelate ligase